MATRSPQAPVKLTRHERRGLMSGLNLSDGHARHEVDDYAGVLGRLPEIFLDSQRDNLRAVERDFELSFFDYAGQPAFSRLNPPLYNYACSLSIEVVASFLRRERMSVSLIHPTFDNLADILRGNGVELSRYEQDWLGPLFDTDRELATDALFIVCPNNPTGQSLTRHEFSRVVEHCALREKLLIIDFSFRFFSTFREWDQYEILLRAGGEFIAFEDSGKTWPTLDLKVGLTLASNDVYEELLKVHEDLVLNVSPFTLRLLKECIDTDANLLGEGNAQQTVAKNRATLRELLAATPLTIPNIDSVISVEWVRLPQAWRTGDLCSWLASRDVHVLPGMPFYWDEPTLGESYIRVALARPAADFTHAASEFARFVLEYESLHPAHSAA